jgi:hypothetical protein
VKLSGATYAATASGVSVCIVERFRNGEPEPRPDGPLGAGQSGRPGVPRRACAGSLSLLMRRKLGHMPLYHLSDADGLRGILTDDVIRATWPRQTSEAIASRVVWLTSRRDADQGWNVNKNISGYIEVTVPDSELIPWSAYRSELPFGAVSGLEASARFHGHGDPSTWLVIRRGIPRSEWVAVVADGQVVLAPTEP